MATRFDRVTLHRPPSAERARVEARSRLFHATTPVESPVLRGSTGAVHVEGRVLPVRPLAAAMSTWLAAVWVTCYLVAPAALSYLGLAGSASAYTLAAIPAFLFAAFATAVGVLAFRPSIHLAGTRADPVLAAILGSLAVWVWTQNGVPELMRPFTTMGYGEIGALLAVNGLEASLLGVMFASFTRSTAGAFALGASFKLVLMGIALGLLSLL